MPGDKAVELRIKRDVVTRIKQEVFNAIEQVVEADIVGDAQELSPVDTGHNANTITGEVEQDSKGNVLARVFTQSGYGGYLELGHKVRGNSGNFVQGRPYIYPSFIKNLPTLRDVIRAKLAAMGGNK